MHPAPLCDRATPAVSDFWYWPKVQFEAVLFDYLLFDYGQPRKMSTGNSVC
jgi:hypothetical protein